MVSHAFFVVQLHDKYQEFVTESEREDFTAILQQVEDWLYEDGEDETKGVYIAKLEELKKVISLFCLVGCIPPPPPNQNCTFDLGFENMQRGDPIEERYKDHSERGAVINQLAYCINSYREAVMSNDPKFDHIDVAEKQKVMTLSSRVLQLMLTRLISF